MSMYAGTNYVPKIFIGNKKVNEMYVGNDKKFHFVDTLKRCTSNQKPQIRTAFVTKFQQGYEFEFWTNGTYIYYSEKSSNKNYVYNPNKNMWETVSTSGLSNYCGSYVWTDGTNTYYSYNGNNKVLSSANLTNVSWSTKTWSGLSNISGSHVWTDGANIYYSSATNQYVLNKSTNTWSTKTWKGLTNFYGAGVWQDFDGNIYYSNDNDQYVLNKETGTWSAKTWTGLTSFKARFIWDDGEDIYCSGSLWNVGQYKLNKTTGNWDSITWNGYNNIDADDIWKSGNNIYFTSNIATYLYDKQNASWNQVPMFVTANLPFDLQSSYVWKDADDNTYITHDRVSYKLDKTTNTWEQITWNGMTPSDGQYAWTDGIDTYYSEDGGQYILNKATNTWTRKNWIFPSEYSENYSYIDGNEIWIDGTDIYYSRGQGSYSSPCYTFKLNKATDTWNRVDMDWAGVGIFGFGAWTDGTNTYFSGSDGYNNDCQYVFNKTTRKWDKKTWNGYSYIVGGDVWTDGDNIYYSHGSAQYVLNKNTSTWTTKTWKGYTSFYGNEVWKSPNGNIYLKSDYVLSKSTSTWQPITWKVLSLMDDLTVSCIWTDGANTYYSYPVSGNGQYVLDSVTRKWNEITWGGHNDLYGEYIWTDTRGNIYYSANSTHYVLDQSTNTWNNKTWNGLTNFDGSWAWNDGVNVYLESVDGDKQYILDQTTDTWNLNISYPRLYYIWYSNIWTDGVNHYYSSGSNQYIFNSQNNRWDSKTWNGLTNFDGMYVWTDGTNIYYSYNNNQYVLNKNTSTWTKVTWNINITYGNSVWTDGNNVYYNFYNGTASAFMLDKTNNLWVSIDFYGSPTTMSSFDTVQVWNDSERSYIKNTHELFDEQNHIWRAVNIKVPVYINNPVGGLSNYFNNHGIWHDGNDTYWSGLLDQDFYHSYDMLRTYKWNKNLYAWELVDIGAPILGDNIFYIDDDMYCGSKYKYDKTLKKWIYFPMYGVNGYNYISAPAIWKNEGNTYLYDLVLDKTTKQWTTKTWYGLDEGTYFVGGGYIWTDLNGITYYSAGEVDKQYVLDPTTSRWNKKKWINQSPSYDLIYGGNYMAVTEDGPYSCYGNKYKFTT